MQYNQPYGVSDPNASYINGNPTTGTMGSIPPAASIENPQREIVNFITDARLTATDSDLHQLAKAVQSNGVIYCDDQGTVNQLVITVNPQVTALIKGMVFIIKSVNANTGPSTLKVDSLAPLPIVHATDQSPLGLGDISPNSLQAYGFDGTNFQMVWSQRQPGAPIYLVAPRDYYVNSTTGSDSYDGTQATVGTGIHGPFQTIQRAANQLPLYNMNGYNQSIHIADGNYTGAYIPKVNGSGQVYIYGNTGNSQAVNIHGINRSALYIATECQTFVDGVTVQSDGTPNGGDGLAGIIALNPGTQVIMGAMTFSACQGAHIAIQRGALASNTVPGCQWYINGGSPGNQYLNGVFCYCYASGSFIPNSGGGPSIAIQTAVSFAFAFVAAVFASLNQLSYVSGAGWGNVTGRKFYVAGNSSITTGGGGANFYPGTIAGVADASTGGYYS